MAVRDVKKYYIEMLNQYGELANDLADFDAALKEGQITEDKVADIKDETERFRVNIQRLEYILYLLELPNRKNKKLRFEANNKELVAYFKDTKSDKDSVLDENKSVIVHIRNRLKSIKESISKEKEAK